MLCIKKPSYNALKLYQSRSAFLSSKMDVELVIRKIKEVDNHQCSSVYETKRQCANDLCCRHAYLDGDVNQNIQKHFFKKINNPIEFVENLRQTVYQLRLFDGYLKWRLLHSAKIPHWHIYQEALGLIAHKSQCILNQMRMIYHDAPANWDERTYHHIGGMIIAEEILPDLIKLNQHAKKVTQEDMQHLIVAEIQTDQSNKNNIE